MAQYNDTQDKWNNCKYERFLSVDNLNKQNKMRKVYLLFISICVLLLYVGCLSPSDKNGILEKETEDSEVEQNILTDSIDTEGDIDTSKPGVVNFCIGYTFKIDGISVTVEANRMQYICLRSSKKLSNFQMLALYEISPKEYMYFFDHKCSDYRTGVDDYASVINDLGGENTVVRFDLDKEFSKTELLKQGYGSYTPNIVQ